MSILTKLQHLLSEPPPEFVFEFSETGIAWAHRAKTQSTGFQPLDPGVLSISPVRDNVLLPDKLQDTMLQLVPVAANKRRRTAAIILPDFCGRVAVLDFDTFPSDPQDQAALVRFRVKKSVPFDLESANISFHVQPHPGGGKKRDVLVAVVAQDILARYEAPVRMAGLQPGMVTLSMLTALNVLESNSLDVVAKISGRTLTVVVAENQALRMFRCVELEAVDTGTMMDILFPTFAYVEDDRKRKPERLLMCGFGAMGENLAMTLGAELDTRVEHLRTAYGTPGPWNAGLLGYLQGIGMDAGAAA